MRQGKEHMSTGELVGLVATALLLGLLIGGSAVLASAPRRIQRERRRTARLGAYAQWLAARRSLTRASISLVAAFRSLAAEQAHSRFFGLRAAEAQRARSDWCDRVRDLDGAEAALLVHGDVPNSNPAWCLLNRVDADALQAAIDGTDHQVRSLISTLLRTDREAEEIVHLIVEGERSNSVDSAVSILIVRLARWIQRITEGWQRR